MKTFLMLILPLVALLLVAAPLFPVFRGAVTGKKAKRNIIGNLCAFFGLCLIAVIVPMGGLVSAADAAAVASSASGLGYIGAALAVGLSGIGSGVAVASSASAALGALSEDSSVFGKSLIFVAMAEGIALYGLIIAFMIIGAL